ncbi:MAG: helix-turn-helix domain-containing protein [Treponema sp.]|jgi:transcriptional regulator with XRE-family HTH domain|nr:helix-turn-helix domain-containing protein [Treponema sp.]
MKNLDNTGIKIFLGYFVMEDNINGNNIRILFSKNLKRLRTSHNISQLTLANEAGLTHNFINDIENCRKWVSPDTIAKLAAVLHVEAYQFFLPDNRADELADNFFSVYLDDFSDSLHRMVGELKNRYLQDQEE